MKEAKRDMRVKACIFDLDGTIIYTLKAIALAGNRMLDALGYAPLPEDEYRYYCGDGSRNLVIRCLKKAGGFTPENVEAGDRLNRMYLAERPLYGARPYEGMTEALETLKREGIGIAVFSNKPDDAARESVSGVYGSLFDHVQGQTDKVPIKPDPAGALAAAARLGAEPEECVYFGDTWTDMRTGENAHMYTVGVLWGYRDRKELEENGADEVIAAPREILDLIRRLEGRKQIGG